MEEDASKRHAMLACGAVLSASGSAPTPLDAREPALFFFLAGASRSQNKCPQDKREPPCCRHYRRASAYHAMPTSAPTAGPISRFFFPPGFLQEVTLKTYGEAEINALFSPRVLFPKRYKQVLLLYPP